MDIKKLFEEAQKKRNNGDVVGAVKDLEAVRKQALDNNDRKMAADAIHLMGVALYQDKNFSEASNLLDQALTQMRQLGDIEGEGAVLRDLGMVAAGEKDFQKAQEYLNQSIQVLEPSSKTGHLGISKVKLGMVLAALEDYSQAEKKIREGIAEIEQSPDRFFESTAYLDLAKVLIKQGRKDEAKQALDKSMQILSDLGSVDEFKLRREEIEKLNQEIAHLSPFP